MTLLSIAADAATRMGLETLTAVVSATSETAQRLYRLSNESNIALSRRHNWTVLTFEKTFTTVAAETQTDTPIPADFDRFVNETMFNRTAKRPLVGPLNAKEWQYQKSLTTSVATDAFRVRGGSFLMVPNPTAGQTVAYEYVSKYRVAVAATPTTGTKTAFTLDDDVALLDEEMITQDVMWRYRASVGLNYAEQFRSAELMIADRISRDGGRRTLDVARSRAVRWPMAPTIPEGNWTL